LAKDKIAFVTPQSEMLVAIPNLFVSRDHLTLLLLEEMTEQGGWAAR
jgi:hypothetical protein